METWAVLDKKKCIQDDPKKNSSTRLEFLRAIGTTTASMALPGFAKPVTAEQERTGRGSSPSIQSSKQKHSAARRQAATNIQYPRIFTGRNLARIAFPLGGIGTGGIGLGGRGNLTDWEIFNRPEVGNAPPRTFGAIWAKLGDGKPVSRVLERRLLPPYDLKPDNLGSSNLPGLPRFPEAKFRGSFPTACVEFYDELCPVLVSLEAFSSFQPVDADASGLPFAILSYKVQNPSHQAAEVVIAWSLENPLGNGGGRKNEFVGSAGMTGISMTESSLGLDDPLMGSVVLATLGEVNAAAKVRTNWQTDELNIGAQLFWFEEFSKTGDIGATDGGQSAVGTVSLRRTIPAGENCTFRFLLSWHFPNRTPARCGWVAPKGDENAVVGNYYCTRFKDAWDVACYAEQNLADLESTTRSFVHSLQSSTMPPVVVEAATANLSTLVSNTSFRIKDGSFQGFEGCGDGKGWGWGTCTHVWNYEVVTQCLFPSLARSIRSTSFGYATDKEGHMDFRHKLPLGKEHFGNAAADGQMGQIVKLYVDWKMSGDTAWLKDLWPACKRALSYAWQPGGWDADRDGIMEGVQHNTYDIEFYGPNPLCETWYLAALKAVTEMASTLGDVQFAETCQNLFEHGSGWTDANLFNGEYYIQKVRNIPESQIAPNLRGKNGPKDSLHPDLQMGTGCLIDQLLGQYIADVGGLGALLNEKNFGDSTHVIGSS